MKTPRRAFFIPDPKIEIPDFLKNDINNFLNINPGLTAQAAGQLFRIRWAGYRASYSEEFISQAFRKIME
jgi:hypothetical protein